MRVKQKNNLDEGDLFQIVPKICQRNFSAETYFPISLKFEDFPRCIAIRYVDNF